MNPRFYKTGVAERDSNELRSLLTKEGTITEWRGGRACGKLNPDFCVTWVEGNERVVLHIWLTCHEVQIEKGSTCLLYDLGNETYEKLKEELNKFRNDVN